MLKSRSSQTVSQQQETKIRRITRQRPHKMDYTSNHIAVSRHHPACHRHCIKFCLLSLQGWDATIQALFLVGLGRVVVAAVVIRGMDGPYAVWLSSYWLSHEGQLISVCGAEPFLLALSCSSRPFPCHSKGKARVTGLQQGGLCATDRTG